MKHCILGIDGAKTLREVTVIDNGTKYVFPTECCCDYQWYMYDNDTGVALASKDAVHWVPCLSILIDGCEYFTQGEKFVKAEGV